MSGKREGGVLQDWRIQYAITSGELGGIFIVGKLYQDPKYRDGQVVRTSIVEKLDYELRIIETRNSIYKMGRQNETL